MRIGTKSLLDGRSCQAGWSDLCALWALVHHHLSVGCEVRLLRHPALPLVHQLSLVSPHITFYDVLCILISAMQIVCWEEAPWNTSLQLLLSSLMRGLGRHLGEISSSSWGKETGRSRQQLKCNGQARYQVHALHWIIRVPRWSLSATRQIFPALIVIGNMHTPYSESKHEYLFDF